MERKEFETQAEALQHLVEVRYEAVINSIDAIQRCKEYNNSRNKIIEKLKHELANTNKKIEEYFYVIDLNERLTKEWRDDPNNPYRMN